MSASQAQAAAAVQLSAETPAQRAKAALEEAKRAGVEAAHLFVQDLDRLIGSAGEIAGLTKVLPPAFTDQVAKLHTSLLAEHPALTKAIASPAKNP